MTAQGAATAQEPWERRVARVERAIAAARRVADAADPAGREARAALPAASGLSREGVELALAEHLETNPTPAELESLVRSAAGAPSCHVVLAANVCVAALRALSLALATSPRVALKPSRRDPVLAMVLARLLGEDPAFAALAAEVRIVDRIDPRPGDEVHVYGDDSTIARIAESLPSETILRGHGTGLGLAVVGSRADPAAAAAAVARDVVPFDQRGCLSPRVVLVEGPAPRAERFADALDGELAAWEARVPRGGVDDATRCAIALYGATAEALGGFRRGAAHGVGVDVEPRALVLPPAARIVHVMCALEGAAPALVEPWAALVSSLGEGGPAFVGAPEAGGDALTVAVSRLVPRARRSQLGRMQRPALDGPVDLRTEPRLIRRVPAPC